MAVRMRRCTTPDPLLVMEHGTSEAEVISLAHQLVP